ncbi:MAG: D-glycero-beta-D-manno-heptose 1,7-bisphosphate 7-phosphatase [Campylobacter sp.]|uniref:D-glycero-beta-D-manno-heptose 1,7-bisphosphate 7-phosphatase n=1 Tax=Campylobacter sp. TaxID=205 RepID=UPI003F9F9E8D
MDKTVFKAVPKKALFLDRDGVINEDVGYVYRHEDFVFKEGIFAALREFAQAGYALVVVTNQSGIGRGYYTLEQFDELCGFMLSEFKKEGVKIEKIYFCPHAPEADCLCRKPKPGMLIKAANELNIDLARSIMIGDKDSDVQAGQSAGVGVNLKLGDRLKSVAEALEFLKKEGKI